MMYKITHSIKLNKLDIALIYVKHFFKVNTEVIWLQEKYDFGVNKHLAIFTPKLFMCQSSFFFFFFNILCYVRVLSYNLVREMCIRCFVT